MPTSKDIIISLNSFGPSALSSLISLDFRNCTNFIRIPQEGDKLPALSTGVDIFSNTGITAVPDRYTQTLAQLRSIREKIPEATIILQACGPLRSLEIFELSSFCDYLILYNQDEESFSETR